VFYWPLDFSWAAHRALDRVKPNLVVLAESELWPNFLAVARKRRVPLALVNARISPKSCRNYERVAWMSRWLFSLLDVIAAQTAEYAGLFSRLGVPCERIILTGSVKYDGVSVTSTKAQTLELAKLLQLESGAPVLIAGST